MPSEAALPTLPDDLRGLNVRDLLEEAAAEVPDRPAVVTRTAALTYAELDRQVDQAASAWLELVIRPSSSVAFLVGSSPEFLIAWLGLAEVGAVLAAINTRYNPSEVRVMLEVARPTQLVAGDAQLETAREAAAETDVHVRSIAEV